VLFNLKLRGQPSTEIVGIRDRVFWHNTCQIFNLFSSELSDLHVIDSDMIFSSSNGLEGVTELLFRDGVDCDADHVIYKLVERDSFTTIRHSLEDGLENGVSSLEVELDNTETREAGLEVQSGEFTGLLGIEVVERFLELLHLLWGDVPALGSGSDLALEMDDPLLVGLLYLRGLKFQIVVGMLGVLVILNVGVEAFLFRSLNGG